MDEQLKVRTKLRTKATKLCNDIREYRKGDPQILEQDELALKIHHLRKVQTELVEIQSVLSTEGVQDDSNHEETVADEIFMASRVLTRLEKSDNNHSPEKSELPGPAAQDLKSSLAVKIPIFSGDIMKWMEFWELYSVSIHQNSRYANVQKFVVLKSHLSGAAKQAIEGIPVSGEGYATAIEVLQKRFQKDDLRKKNLMAQMLEMPAVNSNDLKGMRNLVDHLTAHTRALSTLGVNSDSFSSLLLPMVEKKIPESWRIEWARKAEQEFDNFLEFIQEELNIRESAKSTPTSTATNVTTPSPSVTSTLNAQRQGATGKSSSAKIQRSWSCVACGNGQHGLGRCSKYRQLSPGARLQMARKACVCFQCLGPRHHLKDCTSRTCSMCGERHHDSLHQRTEVSSRQSGPSLSPRAAPFTPTHGPQASGNLTAATRDPPSSQPEHHRYNVTAQSTNPCFYQTAVVQAKGPIGERTVRVLLDGGSDSSYIRSSVAEELELPITRSSTFACIGFQERMEEPRLYNKVKVRLQSRFGDDPVDMELWSTDKLCSQLTAPSAPPPSSVLPEKLADNFTGEQVDILIGIDQLYDVLLWDQVPISDNLRAIDTVFGYVIHGHHGTAKERQQQPHRQSYHVCKVEQMWDLETVGITAKEAAAQSDIQLPEPQWIEGEGRYTMGLLWKSDNRPVSNLRVTRIRAQRMTDKLDSEETVLYQAKMEEMMSNSVIELVSTESEDLLANDKSLVERRPSNRGVDGAQTSASYQQDTIATHEGEVSDVKSQVTSEGEPFHCDTIELEEPGIDPGTESLNAFFLPHHGVFRNDKLRIVFDGSARDGSGRSLNDYLDPGENLLRKLPAVVLNFRFGPVGSQADMKAAFHQVGVPAEDRKYLQFFWSNLQMRFTRVPFGLTCSPFMLLRTVHTHLDKYVSTDLELCEKVKAGSYMDDICNSFSSREEAEYGTSRMKEIFSEAGIELHKVHITGDPSSDTKVLGMSWNTENDQLAVVVPDQPCPSSKSQLLSAVSKPFDPLGVLTPWLIGGKIMFQRTWKEMPNAKWDDLLTTGIQSEVRTWWKNTSNQSVWFSRPLTASCVTSDVKFHVFCDASERAYCTVVYAVQGGESRLVMAKGRLAPVDPNLTIPRLELMAALIGARLMAFIQQSLHLENPSVVFWTDSTDVLCWIRNKKTRKVFVQNRVSAVLELSQPDQWKHVRGTENPADLGTRGISLSVLTGCEKWWRGPPFLLHEIQDESSTLLPELSPVAQTESKVESKTKGGSHVAAVIKIEHKADPSVSRLFDILRCSSLNRVIDRTAWILRFTYNIQHKEPDRRKGPLMPEERQQALQLWIREAQSRAYVQEFRALRSDALVPADSSLLKLRPSLSEGGILYAIPRTNEPELPILPEFAYITTLIVDDAHRKCFHQGTRATLALLSANFMVRRRTVNRVLSTCQRCKRYRGLNYRSADGSLPSFRTEPSRPFAKVGLDFFGPLMVDAGTKVWVMLITCATSRSVHLELVKSQNTDDVKLALRRFFALRGTPALIYSDNAKTFHSLLSHVPRTIKWRFIPEAAPWWGGFWERMVGLTKKCLKITLHLCHLTFDNLAVTLYELAFHLNLRPLTTIDNELITPAHLLFGVTSIHGILSPSGFHCDYIERAWRHRRRVCDHLIRRWTQEYVSMLRSWTVSPRGRPSRIPSEGDVVLVHREGPRGRWPLARVISLIEGPDGKSRAAVIEMRGKRTRRPLNKLYQLEATSASA